MDHAADNGRAVGVGGGFRSTIGQLGLFLARHHPVASGGCCEIDGQRYALNAGAAHAAPPGRSYHEATTPDGLCLAADMVGDLAWINPQLHLFGLKHFGDVNSEKWHWQVVELPNSRQNYDPTKHHPLPVFPLPGDTTPPTDGDLMTPDRRILWDSRQFGGPIPAGNPIPLPIDGADTHKAVTLRVAVIAPAGTGYLTFGDDVADVNIVQAGQTAADTTVVPLKTIGTGKGVAFSCTTAAHIQISLLAFND